MNFSDYMYGYMHQIGCTAAQLASLAGIAPSSISRYLSQALLPSEKTIRKLSAALAEMAKDAGILLSEEEIYASLHESASGIEIDYDLCIRNLKQLLLATNVNNNELAHVLSYDPSYISRILSGSRRPANLRQFLSLISDYLSRRYYDTPYQTAILDLLGSDQKVKNEKELSDLIRGWLGHSGRQEPSQISGFLQKLDEFDLNEYMTSIHFSEIKVPTTPFQIPTTRNYHGLQQMKQAEIDFMKSAVLSKSTEDIIIYSDMPMEEMGKDAEFVKKWMLGIAMILRKGLHIQNIHNVDRPLAEMLLGLEAWIPMYMTGQVTPYYFKEPTSQPFMHLIRSAGSVACSGEAIYGKHANGRYTVTKNKEDVAYYRQRAIDMLNRALPLMKIYRKKQENEFLTVRNSLKTKDALFRRISSAPPLFTMSEKLLRSILKRNGVSEKNTQKIILFFQNEKKQLEKNIFAKGYVLELPQLSREELKTHPVRLPISEVFIEHDIRYTEEEYLAHLDEARAFEKKHDWFTCAPDPHATFRNIEITICVGNFVIVSKSNAPTIHFIIHHPKMIQAFEQFVPPITEEDSKQQEEI